MRGETLELGSAYGTYYLAKSMNTSIKEGCNLYTIEYLRQNKVTVIEYPPFSPDLAMCDFWLFNNLRKT